MADDFYTVSARQRLERIEAERAATQADLAAYKANADYESAGQAIQQLANFAAEQENLTHLYNRYVESQRPAPREHLSQEEINARPWNKMTPQDALELARGSRYGKNLTFDDPHVRAGFYEAQRRRNRGE
jgi:hypothetical protein